MHLSRQDSLRRGRKQPANEPRSQRRAARFEKKELLSAQGACRGSHVASKNRNPLQFFLLFE